MPGVSRGMWDLVPIRGGTQASWIWSPIRGGTQASWIGSLESYSLDHQGSPQVINFQCSILAPLLAICFNSLIFTLSPSFSPCVCPWISVYNFCLHCFPLNFISMLWESVRTFQKYASFSSPISCVLFYPFICYRFLSTLSFFFPKSSFFKFWPRNGQNPDSFIVLEMGTTLRIILKPYLAFSFILLGGYICISRG